MIPALTPSKPPGTRCDSPQLLLARTSAAGAHLEGTRLDCAQRSCPGSAEPAGCPAYIPAAPSCEAPLQPAPPAPPAGPAAKSGCALGAGAGAGARPAFHHPTLQLRASACGGSSGASVSCTPHPLRARTPQSLAQLLVRPRCSSGDPSPLVAGETVS